MVVWDEEKGYVASITPYPTNIGAPRIELPNIDLIKNESTKKMVDIFNKEKKEIIDKIEKLYQEYNDSILVWGSKISFDPIVGETYYLYNFGGVNTLSLISPEEWNKKDSFMGTFELSSDRKWIRK